MQVPLRKILDLAAPDRPADARAAAVLVLAELGLRDGAVTDAVLAALADPDDAVRLQAVVAAGTLRLDKALPLLSDRIKAGGEEGERAAEAAARLGARGTRMLHELMPRVAPGLRRYIAAALAGAAAASGGDLAQLEILLDKDPAVVEAAVQALAGAIPRLDARRKKSVAEKVLDLAAGKKAALSRAAEAGMVRLVGLLDDPGVAELLWDHILPPHPAEARARALAALGKWVTSPSKEQRQRLFRCAGEGDFRVAGPALMILDKLPMTDKLVAEWLPLLQSQGVSTRRLALSKVGDRDTAEVAEALAGQLSHGDRAYREEVLGYLGRTGRGRAALAQRLADAESAEAAWPLAQALGRLAAAEPEAWAEALFPQAAAYLEEGDRRADPLLFVAREASPAGLREKLEKRAAALVAKKAFERAHRVYRALTRDPAAGFPYRLAQATLGLKLSAKELSPEGRGQDACLEQFANLARQDREAVLGHLAKTGWVEAEELYYLGFHFAEHGEEELRGFGAAALEQLIARYGRVKLAAAAKKKLESAGLAKKKGRRG